MKIIHFMPTIEVGGAETLVVNTLIDLKKCGHDVSLFVIYGHNTVLKKKLKENNIDIYEVMKADILDADSSKLFIKLIKGGYVCYKIVFLRLIINNYLLKNKSDIVHLHLEISKYFRDCKYGRWYYTCHSDFERYINMYGKNWYKRIVKLTEKGLVIIAINKGMVNEIKDRIPDSHIEYLPNGIDIDSFKSKSISKNELTSELCIPQDSFLICHIGRIDPVKNHLKSISILNYIIKNYGNKYYLLIVGTGKRNYVDELKVECDALGISDNVIFMGFREDVSEIISASDACILPSISEGFSLTAIEYQIHNKRSVVSNVIPKEVICNENCIQLAIDKDDKEWAELLLGNYLEEHNNDINSYDKEKIIIRLLKIYNGE